MLRLTEATESTFAQFSKNVVVTVADMGFLKVRTVKGHDYPMWCKRVRSRLKSGGDGSVKSLELSLGTRYKYAAFYLHERELDYQAFAYAYLTNRLDSLAAQHDVLSSRNWQITLSFRGTQITLTLKGCNGLDARSKVGRVVRTELLRQIQYLERMAGAIADHIKVVTEAWQNYAKCLQNLEQQRAEYQRYLKNPHAILETRTEERYDEVSQQWERQTVNICWADNAELILDEYIQEYGDGAAQWLASYEARLQRLSNYVPPKRRQDFINSLEHRIRGKA